MKIEKMQKNHVSEIARISADCFTDPWSTAAYEAELENSSAETFVAVENDIVIGFGNVQKVLDEAYITNIAVEKKSRKNGVGGKILDAIINHCKNENCSFVSLEVRVSNVAAINLYEKYGFVSQGIRKGFYSHPTEDANIMTLFLGE